MDLKILKERLFPPKFKSADYWKSRYETGGTSGSGSYGRLARHKAEVVNALVKAEEVRSVVEFGSGDGAQAELFEIPEYHGVDVAPLVVERGQAKFADRPNWRFSVASETTIAPQSYDLAMSLDVIFHLTEDRVFRDYMRALTAAPRRLLLVYSSDHDEQARAVHVRHRAYSEWIARHAPEFELVETIEQPFPLTDGSDPNETTFAFFRVFRRVATP